MENVYKEIAKCKVTLDYIYLKTFTWMNRIYYAGHYTLIIRYYLLKDEIIKLEF